MRKLTSPSVNPAQRCLHMMQGNIVSLQKKRIRCTPSAVHSVDNLQPLHIDRNNRRPGIRRIVAELKADEGYIFCMADEKQG